MSQEKQASEGNLSRKALTASALGAAGLSLAAATTGSEALVLSPAVAPQEPVFLGEEEISDVSLATFHLFDKEDLGTSRSLLHLTRCGHGCGHGCGGRGCGGRGCGGHGCGGHGCGGHGCRCGGHCGHCGRGCGGCGGCGCGGCGWSGGCCLSIGYCRWWC